MIENNRLDKFFGPAGTSAGIVLFAAGVILTFFHLTGLILILIGAFTGFSYTSVLIDYDRKRVRFSNNLFGILKTGRWLQIEPVMSVGIRESNQTWSAYSQGNRALDIATRDFRVILLDSANREIMPLKKTTSIDSAKAERATIVNKLGLQAAGV